MGLFRRGPKEGGAADAPADVPQVEAVVDTPAEDEAADVDARGPWDAEAIFPAAPRVDLGAILLPPVEGMEVRLEVDKATNVVSAVAVLLEGSSLQLQAFAAPRSEGIWDEIREEIAASITQQGGTVDDLPGPFGRELLARLPVRTPEGRTGHRPARFIGSDGPRWFLRGVLTGRAAVEPDAAGTLENLFSQVVVVRGTDARPPRDLLPLQLPGGATPPTAPAEQPRFAPPARGPEITEIG
ncbi:DUF3710 domain-containing protein [Cellulomonas phragmiteti]|uniref:DUF3710 domain-containing protein n=1 Tax=Cellulomonas phragmiteti TaxID=478780 RepID=A0ABQ4DQ10_9CELL|nr:DUF3710 domain-containing protein [Cellulomonas phragmiteti]GIG41016.1 hypothetical protein Cph01nite_27780 [Cellulomonas phragmiteti]